MDIPSTATFGAGSGALSAPARGPARAAPAVAEETLLDVQSVQSSAEALTALSVAAETAISAATAPAPVAVAVPPLGSAGRVGAGKGPRHSGREKGGPGWSRSP
eukprot:11448131-Alexandrium_andersonii.AAC.1